MDHLKNKYLNRIENFLTKLNNVISLVNGEESSSKEGDLSADDEQYIIDYASALITKYVLSVCNDNDLSEDTGSQSADQPVDGSENAQHSQQAIEESVESQKLVEHECSQVYSARMALVLRNLISSAVSLHSFDSIRRAHMFSFSEEMGDKAATTADAAVETVNKSDSNGSCFDETDSSFDSYDSKDNFLHTLDFSDMFEKLDQHREDASDFVYSTTDVSNLLKFRVCKLVLEFISDLPIRSNGPPNPSNSNAPPSDTRIGIRYSKHGRYILRRFCYLCMSVSPLKSEMHLSYLKSHLSHSGPTKMLNLGHLSSSRPWIVYWSLHSLCLLGEDITPYKERAINTLFMCWDSEYGGFGGGRSQRGHLATTYAAICVLKMFHSLHLLDTHRLYSFLMDMKLDSGAFTTAYGGEYDTRSTYCAIASASMAGLLTEELTRNTAEFIESCQTYEGGIAAEPGLEAHAGYTYCGVACLAILGQLHRIDLDRLHHWAVCRVTGQFGFQGRPHKLVDSCYSFWIGGVLKIITTALTSQQTIPNPTTGPTNTHTAGATVPSSTHTTDPPTNASELIPMLIKCYLLVVAQTGKGFRDKPNKSPDLYHTCYSLSYLNIVSPMTKHTHNVLLNVLEMYLLA